MQYSLDQVKSMQGKPVYASDGDKVGTVEDVYQDVASGQPEWIGVGTGLFGRKHVLVPVATVNLEGDRVRLPYGKDKVGDAPDVDQDEISEEIERRLCEYYGVPYSHQFSSTGLPEGPSPAGPRSYQETGTEPGGQPARAGMSGYQSTHVRFPGIESRAAEAGDGSVGTAGYQAGTQGTTAGGYGYAMGQGTDVMEIDSRMRRCISDCLECNRVCIETVTYCLQQGGRYAELPHIRLLLDCAEMCRTSADFMLRQSDLHTTTCGICAQICERCADDCAGFSGDRVMQRCVDSCRRCSDSCREVAGMSTGVGRQTGR